MDMNHFSTILDLDRPTVLEPTTSVASSSVAVPVITSAVSSSNSLSDLPSVTSYHHHHHHHHQQQHQLNHQQQQSDDVDDDDGDDDCDVVGRDHHANPMNSAAAAHHMQTNGYDAVGYAAYCNTAYDPYVYAPQTFVPLPPYNDIRNAVSLPQPQTAGGAPVVGGVRKREKQKRQRTAYSSEQLMHLEESFTANQYLNRARRIDLARTLRLTERQIKIWFQNRRMKEKKSKRDSGQVESTSGTVPGPPATMPVTTTMGGGCYSASAAASNERYVNGTCSPTAKMMKYSPTSSFSTPSPPMVVGQQQQLVLDQLPRQGPSTTLHHYSYGAAVDMYNGPCPPPPAVPLQGLTPSAPPSYEQSVCGGNNNNNNNSSNVNNNNNNNNSGGGGGGGQQHPLHHHHAVQHLHWYNTAAAHPADGLQ